MGGTVPLVMWYREKKAGGACVNGQQQSSMVSEFLLEFLLQLPTVGNSVLEVEAMECFLCCLSFVFIMKPEPK